MTSAIGILVEEARQRATGDRLFWRRLPPVFELRVPARATGGSQGSYLFPLPMPPRELSEDYPFAAEITPTARGGAVADENGIITWDIRLTGTMGQRVKQYRGGYFGLIRPAERRHSGHEVVHRTKPGAQLSGHRMLLHLKHAVFGLYSDLKQDPETAEETQLILHLPKDDAHYLVVPTRVTFPRDAGRSRMSYDYEISLTGVAMAKALPDATEDKALLAKLLDAVAAVRSAIRLGKAAINDLNRIRAEIERIARQFTGAFNDIASVFEDLEGFLDNTKRSVTTTRARAEAAIDRLEAALTNVGASLSDDTAQIALEVSDSVHGILVHPELFEPSSAEVTEAAFRRGLGLLTSRSRTGLEAASGTAPPATEAELRRAGTLPGDLVRDDRARELPEEFRQYRSAFEVEVGGGDTLESLAARYLGDARRWRHLAILNALQEPYISDIGFPNTRAPGARILVPSTEAAARRRANPAVLGSRPEDPADVRELGVDWLTEVGDDGREDWAIDVDGGSVDLRIASGVPCLAQDLRARVETPQGSDPIYRTFGAGQVIGFGALDLEVDAVRLRIAESLEADPRVAEASDVTLLQVQPGTIAVDARVFVRGLRDTVAVQASTVPPAAP